jgi:hypothetical protein
MAKLKDEVKLFIIQQLAMFKTPQEVADLVKENYGLEVKRQNIFIYHPDQGKVSQKLKAIFSSTRKQFLETVSDIPIANQAYRIDKLQHMLDVQLRKGERINSMLVMNILEQAAKEVGGMFTNTRQITGKDGKPIFDTVDIAKAVFHDLINNEGFKEPDAIKFVAEHYKIPEEQLVSDANN